jgi:hypothetical protein
MQAAQGVPEELRMVHLGHSTKAAHRIYTHREVEQLRQIADTVPSVLKIPPSEKSENSDDSSEISHKFES